MSTPLKVFCCYAREDQEMLEHLKKHLASLVRQGQITLWSDTDLDAGVEWEKELHAHLEQSDIILLLISPDFMASDYCYSTEMRRAIERHEEGNAHVVPIILRATFWRNAPFAKLQIIPKDARPIKSWSDLDEAFNDATEHIYQVVAELHARSIPGQAKVVALSTSPKLAPPSRSKEYWLAVGNEHYNARRYAEALDAYEQAIGLDPKDALAYMGKGQALISLKRSEEALAFCERAVSLDPTSSMAYYYKGDALNNIKCHEEALDAFERAIYLDPTNALAYMGKGVTLSNLGYNGYNEEALTVCEQAIRLDPINAPAYVGKGLTLSNLGYNEEALAAFEQAIRLDSMNAPAYMGKGLTLSNLGYNEEALAAFEQALSLDPTDALTYYYKGAVLEDLCRQKEAQQAYKRAQELSRLG